MQRQPVNERVRSHRDRLRNAGLKPVQMWVPDPKAPGFAAECRRQSLLILNDPTDLFDLESFADVAAWEDE